ncbi:hypothetical protein DSO57_1024279 [Entomophthora muscae]|uniref:Uncharacterized protein n=1 Tax=Entomophthora muscae TaxID=34485 RepID=A0ACC2RTK6_9FUNG|nr:hypothetical protein DSO57_1024279 [Entomophthora muscae]
MDQEIPQPDPYKPASLTSHQQSWSGIIARWVPPEPLTSSIKTPNTLQMQL